jgi:hypothetical protein
VYTLCAVVEPHTPAHICTTASTKLNAKCHFAMHRTPESGCPLLVLLSFASAWLALQVPCTSELLMVENNFRKYDHCRHVTHSRYSNSDNRPNSADACVVDTAHCAVMACMCCSQTHSSPVCCHVHVLDSLSISRAVAVWLQPGVGFSCSAGL